MAMYSYVPAEFGRSSTGIGHSLWQPVITTQLFLCYYYNYKNHEKSERIFEQAKCFLCVFQLGLHAFHRIILLRPLLTTLLTPLLSHFIFAPDKSLVILWKMRLSDKVRKNSP